MPKTAAENSEYKNFLTQYPDIAEVEAFVVDASGVLRGKRLPVAGIKKLFSGGLRMARSVYALDIYGNDVLKAGLVTETGDGDGVCFAVKGSLKPVSWLDRPTAQVMLDMQNVDGTEFFGNTRRILARVLERFHAKGLSPVMATELEFYLYSIDKENRGYPAPPLSPKTGRRQDAVQTYSIAEMREFDAALSEIRAACEIQGVPADTVLSENGPGQFEVNLLHSNDILAAADQAVYLKRIVKGAAEKHGLGATFMAKPYSRESGNGFHTHISVLDKNGGNIFAGKTQEGSEALHHAAGGILKHMADCMAVFAPNINSYRRFGEGTHAPTKIAWGYDNRSVALRVPDSDLENTRLEHRVAGADAHPYLVPAVILGAMLNGIEKQIKPPPLLTGNAYDSDAETLPVTWGKALQRFENSEFIADTLGADYRGLYAACKRQEKMLFESRITDVEYNAYLRDV